MSETETKIPELTPEAVRGKRFGRSLRGYDPSAVDTLLREVATGLEATVAERDELRARVQRLETEVGDHREVQHLMREALASAETAADELRERTQRECDELLERARAQAQEIEAGAHIEREHAEAGLERLRAQEQELRASYRVLLAAALERLEERGGDDPGLPSASMLDALAPRQVTEPSPASD